MKLVDATNKVLYHVAREGKQRYEVEDKIRFPFSPPRDYSKWPQYKQEAEELLETERKEKWSDYPSRNDCLFVSADEESAKEWARSIFSQNTLLYIYTIKAINGKIVFLDTDWFEGLGELLSKNKQFITHNHSKEECISTYWSGCQMRKAALFEGLFYGEAIVLKKTKLFYDAINRTFSGEM